MIQAVLIFNNHGKPRLSKFYTPLSPQIQQSLLSQIFQLVSDRSSSLCNFLDAPDLRFPRIAQPGATGGSSSSSSGKRRGESEVAGRRGAKGRLARGLEEYDEDEEGLGSGSRVGGDPWATPRADRFGPESDEEGLDEEEEEDEEELRVIYRHYATLYFVFVVDGADSELGILDLIQVFVESLDRSFENVCELDLIFHFDEVLLVLSEIVQGGLVLETNINEISACVQRAAAQRKASSASPAAILPSSLNSFAQNLTSGRSGGASGGGASRSGGFSRGVNSGGIAGRWLQGFGVGA